jgi:hypothetical protein
MLLTFVDPTGVISGFCFGAASTADQQMAETFFAVRVYPSERLISVDTVSSGPYVPDNGFEGAENCLKWLRHYGARVIHLPKRNSKKPWSKRLRRWVASIRQIVESTYDKLFNTSGLRRECLPELEGCGHVWRRGRLCTTSASGSTINSVVPGLPSPTCWGGERTIYTKCLRRRLRGTTALGDGRSVSAPTATLLAGDFAVLVKRTCYLELASYVSPSMAMRPSCGSLVRSSVSYRPTNTRIDILLSLKRRPRWDTRICSPRLCTAR